MGIEYVSTQVHPLLWGIGVRYTNDYGFQFLDLTLGPVTVQFVVQEKFEILSTEEYIRKQDYSIDA